MDLSKIIVPPDILAKPIITCVIEGILEDSDLRELTLSTELATEPLDEDPADLSKVREKHHSVARMIAGGLTQRMVSKLCGYTESYLSILLNNPAMAELVQLYRIQQGSAALVITERLRTVGLKAIEKLEADLDADNLNKQEKLALAKLGLDRGGHGPASKQHVVNETHIFDHAELERRNRAARQRNAAHIVPSSDVRRAISPPTEEQTDETSRPVDQETPGISQHRCEPRQSRLPLEGE